MSPKHYHLFIVIILSSLFYNASSRYHEWLQRDEDTVQRGLKQPQISLADIVDNRHNNYDKHHERNSHKDDEHSDADDSHVESLETTTLVVVEFKDRDGSSLSCGGSICIGTGAYCCRLSDGSRGCCWTTYIYQLWWFWMIWLVLFFTILACSLICWRRRRARYRYVVMENSQYPSYGNSVHTTCDSSAHLAPPLGYPYGTTAPTAPPVYSPSEKPPAYSN